MMTKLRPLARSLGSRSPDADVYAVISQPYIVRPDGKDPPTGAGASRRGRVCLPPCSPVALLTLYTRVMI